MSVDASPSGPGTPARVAVNSIDARGRTTRAGARELARQWLAVLASIQAARSGGDPTSGG